MTIISPCFYLISPPAKLSRYEGDGAEGEAEYSSDDAGEASSGAVSKRKGKKPSNANNGSAKAVEDC